jgi:hypothetical protein
MVLGTAGCFAFSAGAFLHNVWVWASSPALGRFSRVGYAIVGRLACLGRWSGRVLRAAGLPCAGRAEEISFPFSSDFSNAFVILFPS